jgi:hypothetical protein
MVQRLSQKEAGAYYTPDAVVATLLRWAVRNPRDRLIDPSCGDGRFIAGHRNSVGIEQDVRAAGEAIARAPWAFIYDRDFFAWASETKEHFDCAAGNPPFIRYQRFKRESRARAIELCARLGADFTGLASSWAPFLVATAGLLRGGGRLAFVVPAEIGHGHMQRHCWITLSIISQSSTLWRSGKNFSPICRKTVGCSLRKVLEAEPTIFDSQCRIDSKHQCGLPSPGSG